MLRHAVGSLCAYRPTHVRLTGSEEEWQHFNEGFDRIASKGKIDSDIFATQVIGAPVPRKLAGRVFDVCDTRGKGLMSRQDFLCCITLLKKGTESELLKCMNSLTNLLLN